MWAPREELLEGRKRVFRSYTFHRFESNGPAKVLSTERQQLAKIPTLSIHTNVEGMIHELDETTVLRRPRLDQTELRKELKASSARLQMIKNGCPLSEVIRKPTVLYPLQEARKVAFVDEKDTVKRPRVYVVPQSSCRKSFVFPDEVVKGDPIAIQQNKFNAFKNEIYEEDRKRYNETIEDLNRRNMSREQRLSTQYEDLVKYGLNEARRRARTTAKIEDLSRARTEEWWPSFVNECPRDHASLGLLKLLTRVGTIRQATIEAVYRDAIRKYKGSEKKLKDLIIKLNEKGAITESSKLLNRMSYVENMVQKGAFGT